MNMKNFKFINLAIIAVLAAFTACDNIPEPSYWANNDTTKIVEPVIIYHEDFGTNPNGLSNPLVTAYDSYKKEGIGAAKVTYTSEGAAVSIRTTSASSGYAGASGACNAMMASAGGASLLINDIATCGAKNLTLSFGSNQMNDTIAVSYKINGTTTWVPIEYSKSTTTWGLVENVVITLPAGTNTIKLKFTAGKTAFGARVDDIKIMTSDVTGAAIVDPDSGGPGPNGNDIYYEDFGTTATGNPLVTAYTGYTKAGIGAAAVTYTSEGAAVSIRTTSASSGYAGASGSCNAMMASAGGASLLINDIATCGAKNLTLSFGSNQMSDTIAVAYKINGTTTWVPISYSKTTTTWGLVSNLAITLPTGTNTIKLKFTAGKTGFGSRVDDIKITTTDVTGPAIIDPDSGSSSTLSVNPSSLSFVQAGEAKNFTVTSSTTWNAVSSDPTNFPVSVSGNTVTVTATANPGATRTAKVTITTTDLSVSQVVNLTQAGTGVSTVTIFYETFGSSGPSASPRPSVVDYTDYDNGAPIVFSGNADVRSTSTLDSHVWLAAYSTQYPDLKYLTISGINTSGATNLNLSFDLAANGAVSSVFAVLTVTVKDLNTSAETSLTLPATALGASNTYSTLSNITGIPATSNLEITFTGTQQNTMGLRLDNIKIEGDK